MDIRNKGFWVVIAACLLLGCGCATMNASECQNADWKMIGFEDGSNGKLPSYVGEHRQACAKYNIIPDFDIYLKGHSKGVESFCTEANGFLIGENGTSYNGVCPDQLSHGFLNGYRIGVQFYALSNAIDTHESSIWSNEQELENLRERIRSDEAQFVNEKLNKDERRHLLEKIKRNQRTIGVLETKIRQNRKDLSFAEYEYEQLEIQYSSFLTNGN